MTLRSPKLKSPAKGFDRNLPVLRQRTKRELVETAARAFQGVHQAKRLLADESAVKGFIREVGRWYHNNPYHNFHHAVDTTNMMAWLLTRPAFKKNIPDLHAFVLLVTALVHDMDHPGTDNQWEIKTHSEMARKYHNHSVLECRSRDVAMWILAERTPEFIAKLSAEEWEQAKKLMDQMVIATDFSRHGAFLVELEDHLANGGIDFSDPADLSVISRTLIKSADISNTAKRFSEARLWGRRILKEYWAQGEMEKDRSLPVGPLNDKDEVDFPEAQAWFIETQALKLFELLAQVEGQVGEAVEGLKANLVHYRKMAKRQRR